MAYMTAGQNETDKRRRRPGTWLIGLAGFLVLVGFFSVVLAPSEQKPTREPPAAYKAPAIGPASPKPDMATLPASTATALPAVGTPAPAIEPLPPAAPDDGTPKVAIMVADLGPVPTLARAAIAALPPEIGMGFSPYGTDLAALTAAARAGGHEVWVGIPMQPKRYPAIDPGKNTLLVGADSAENIRRFGWALAQIPGSKTGVYNFMGSAFTASDAALGPILKVATSQGLMFVDARSGMDTVGPKVAAAVGMRAALSRGFLDDTPDQLSSRLAELVAASKRDGQAVGMIEAKPASVSAIQQWSGTLPGQGVKLVSVAQLAR